MAIFKSGDVYKRQDYKSSVKLLSEKITKVDNSIKVINISEDEREKLEKLFKERNLWIAEQKKIEIVRKLDVYKRQVLV